MKNRKSNQHTPQDRTHGSVYRILNPDIAAKTDPKLCPEASSQKAIGHLKSSGLQTPYRGIVVQR